MADVALVCAYNDKGQLLLGKRRDNGQYTLSGGHIDPGEDPKAAAARELMEETGLHATSISFIKEYTGANGVHLYCYSAYVHGEPHSDNDPDEEVPSDEWVWVDVSDGLPSKYYNKLTGPDPESGDNFVAQLFDIEKSEDSLEKSEDTTDRQSTDIFDEPTDLIKMRTAPTLPGLGVPDDRRETPIVTTPLQLRTKQLGSVAHAARVYPEHRARIEAASRDSGMGYTSIVPGAATSYSKGTALREEQIKSHPLAALHYGHNNADITTQLHENFHMTMNRVQAKHGREARVEVAEKLYHMIPSGDKKTVDEFMTSKYPTSHPFYHEESIAALQNYLNNPGEREAFHTQREHSPEYAREFGNSMKRAHRAVTTLAPTITPEHLGKGVLDPNLGYKIHGPLPGEDCDQYYEARTPAGELAGYTNLHFFNKDGLTSDDTWVAEPHQRKGIASALYAHAEASNPGRKMMPSPLRSYAGIGLWEGNKKNPQFGKAVLDPNAGYRIEHKVSNHVNYYETNPAKRNFQTISVSAIAPNGEEVARANCGDDDNGNFSVGHVHVKPEHRRKGLASAMYARAEKVSGKKLMPSTSQTQEGQALWAGNEQAPQFGKAESEIDRLLNHPDPIERQMALRLDSVKTPDVSNAALDPDPTVHEAAIDHPLFGEVEGHNLMQAKEGSDGQYPLRQKLAFLERTHRVTPGHINSVVNSLNDAPPEARNAILDNVIHHPSLTPANVRSIYRNMGATHDHRMTLAASPSAPQDVLEHAIQGSMLFPSPDSEGLGLQAASNPNLGPDVREDLVNQTNDNSPPHFTHLASTALASGPVTPDIGQGLHLQRVLKPSSPYVHALMGAYLRGPTATKEDLDQALTIPNPAVWRASLKSPHLQPAHMDKLVGQATAAGDKPSLSLMMNHPLFDNRHLKLLMPTSTTSNHEPLAKSESSASHADIANLVNEPIVMLQHGVDPTLKGCFKAAKFLAGGADVDLNSMRRALYVEDGNTEAAALRAYGFTVNEANLKALKSIQALKDLGKIEDVEPNAQQISNPQPEGEDVAQAVSRAFENHFVFYVKMGGKHSSGSMLAHDEQTHTTYLLKSGSGGAGAAAGASQDPSNPNDREAAWYHVAVAWGMEQSYPRAEAIDIDGQRYAAMKLLPLSYRSLEDLKEKDPGAPRRILEPYLRDGTLHQWLICDYILGNADSHLGNVLTETYTSNNERHFHAAAPKEQPKAGKQPVTLIDHGSAFAGPAFDPAHDQASFVPGYARAWCLNLNFSLLPAEEKLRHLPRVDRDTDRTLMTWLENLDINKMIEICQRYGINYGPQVDRMNKLKALAESKPVSESVNLLWCTT